MGTYIFNDGNGVRDSNILIRFRVTAMYSEKILGGKWFKKEVTAELK